MQQSRLRFSLQGTILWLVCSVVAISLLVTGILIERQTAYNTANLVEEKATSVARTIATVPMMAEALSGKRPEEQIQHYADLVRQKTGMEYIVIMDMNGIRKSHPDVSMIGKPFVGGDEKPALQGQEHVSYAEGTLGKSLRAFKPIVTEEGVQVGAVAVGISLEHVEDAVTKSRWIIYLGLLFGAVAGGLGAILLARKIKRILFGLEPSAIAHMLEQRSAMLQSIREGIVAVERDGRVTLMNDEARRLFDKAGVNTAMVGKYADEIIPGLLRQTIRTKQAVPDSEIELRGISLVVNSVPIFVNGKVAGAIATFRDKTELSQLAERLTGVRMYADALRAQAHEFMNKLHVILGLVHMKEYDRLQQYVSEVANRHQEDIGLIMRQVREPVIAGFLLGKMSRARELGITLQLSETSFLPESEHSTTAHQLITIMGNLVDNAMEALSNGKGGIVRISFYEDEGMLSLKVIDNGLGIPEHIRPHIFELCFSTKGEDRGYGLHLVQQCVAQACGTLEVESTSNIGTSIAITIPYPSKRES
ncbi:DcuS/MalK family sensor histidine kinase [Paenibacillus sp. SC116]|uniref:DcuS/MalK family sensor histidine kinase n=1 Tax=Paenibacillus sp. SC116 TaxID=2968986 RepID=UPI00215B7668|nr:DcuS/MalK family sensor histidine kinase [Paenibacillus sp. SC116]MCR8843295.1 DcuS/MalK family sensor histidine kinase [Paenibacillus sp. SC116]